MLTVEMRKQNAKLNGTSYISWKDWVTFTALTCMVFKVRSTLLMWKFK